SHSTPQKRDNSIHVFCGNQLIYSMALPLQFVVLGRYAQFAETLIHGTAIVHVDRPVLIAMKSKQGWRTGANDRRILHTSPWIDHSSDGQHLLTRSVSEVQRGHRTCGS